MEAASFGAGGVLEAGGMIGTPFWFLLLGWMLLTVVTGAFASGALLGVLGPIENPLGIDGLTSVYTTLLLFVSPLLTAAAVFSLFVRLRRAGG